MAFWLVLDNEILAFSAGKLGIARLLGVEMIEACLAGDDFTVFGDSQSF